MKRRVLTFIGMMLAMMVVFAGAAFASEVVDDAVGGDDSELRSPEIVTAWDDEAGAVVISVGTTDEGADPCENVSVERVDGELVIVVEDPDGVTPAEESPQFNEGDEGATVDESDDVELPPGCYVFDGVAEDGKVNHGTMVSAVASQLSPHDLDVPKGWIMRMVAKEKPTKVKASETDDPDDRDADEGDSAADEESEAKSQAKAEERAARAEARAQAKAEKEAARAEKKAEKANDKAHGKADKGKRGG